MKSRFQPTAPSILYTLGTVVLSGSLVSALYTTDHRWMDWHFSRLGEGGHPSSILFNLSMFIGGILMFLLGSELARQISSLGANKSFNITYAETLVKLVFTVMSLCLVGVSLFPFDRFPVIHNSFGYGMTFMVLSLCSLTPKYIPLFSKWFYKYGYAIQIISLVLFAVFFIWHPYTLLQVEIVVFVLVYIWLVVFVSGVYDKTRTRLTKVVKSKQIA